MPENRSIHSVGMLLVITPRNRLRSPGWPRQDKQYCAVSPPDAVSRCIDFPSMSNFHSYKLLERLCTVISPQVQRQQPVTFRDALDRVAPIHLEWVSSHEAFMAVLKIQFKHIGLSKIEKGEFVVQALGSTDDIDLSDPSKPWESCFVPGQHVNMSMTFKRRDIATSVSCPACNCEHDGGSSSIEITW